MKGEPIFRLTDWSALRGPDAGVGPVDLAFWPGEVVTLMGPSGVGKTTFLMAMLGYEDRGLTVTGERRQHGTLVGPGQVPKRALYIPQNVPFNPNWEVLGFLCRLPWGSPGWLDTLWPTRPRRRRRVLEVLGRLGLASRAQATVAQLSGGEAQRAALAQILLMESELSLLVGDEFVSALDPGLAVWILDQIREIVRHSGAAAVLALHDVQAALHVSDRVLICLPPAVTSQPWVLVRGNPGWHPDVMHTILCLARWVMDVDITPGIRQLLVRLHRLAVPDAVPPLEPAQDDKQAEGVLLAEDGSETPLDKAKALGLLAGLESLNGSEVSPIRHEMGSETLLGFQTRQRPPHTATVLVRAKARRP